MSFQTDGAGRRTAPGPPRIRRLMQPKVILTLILFVFCLWIRLRLLGYTDMWWDQSTTLNRTLEWLRGGPLPLSSMVSTFGVYNAPMAQYLYALPLLLCENLVAVSAFIAVFNLLGIAAAAFAAAKVFGWRVAWWSALLFAVCPWAALFGRLVWMQSFVPGASAMLLACLLLYFGHSPRPAYLVLAPLCLSVAIQTHLTSVALVPIVAAAVITFRRSVRLRPLLLGIFLFALTFVPFLAFQAQTDLADWHRLREGLGGSAQINLDSLRQIAVLLTSMGEHPGLGLPLELRVSPTLDLRCPVLDNLAIVLLLLGALSGLIAAVRGWKGPERTAAWGSFILLLWLCLPPLLFVYHTHPLVHYYFLHALPAPFLLVGLLADRIYSAIASWGRQKTRLVARACSALALGAFLPLAIVAAYQARLDIVDQNRRASGDYGHFRMADVQQAIDVANELMVDRPECQIVVLSEVALGEGSRFGLLREFVGRDRVRFSQAGVTFLYPDPCAVYFQGTMSLVSEGWLQSITDPMPEHTIETPGETWTFYDLTEEARAAATEPLQSDAPIATWPNGISLTRAAYQELYEPEGQAEALPHSLVITTTWAVGPGFQPDPLPTSRPDNPDEYLLEGDGKWSRRIHTGHYLLSEGNVLMSQYDTIGLDSREWRAGDLFEIRVHVPVPQDLPPGRYSVAVALYWYPAVVKLPLEGSDLDLATLGWVDWSP
jgi:4-amino-4-deoxy-L-arabinose transferase-like glycosyltransferase